jgi:hypothetical protein
VDEGYPCRIAESLAGELGIDELPEDFRDGIDAAFRDAGGRTYLFSGKRFLRVAGTSVTTGPVSEAEETMDELAELARSSGVVVLDQIVQRRGQLDPRTLVGSGKLKELLVHAMQLGVDMIIFDRDLTPASPRGTMSISACSASVSGRPEATTRSPRREAWNSTTGRIARARSPSSRASYIPLEVTRRRSARIRLITPTSAKLHSSVWDRQRFEAIPSFRWQPASRQGVRNGGAAQRTSWAERLAAGKPYRSAG